MQLNANSPDDYIQQLPTERQIVMKKLRQTILDAIPNGYTESMSYGMLSYGVPHSIYPKGYHCKPEQPLPFVSIASQKQFISLYHMGLYSHKPLLDWFLEAYPKHCKRKLDMGKSCIRFKKIEEIPYGLIAELLTKVSVDEWITIYEKNIRNKK